MWNVLVENLNISFMRLWTLNGLSVDLTSNGIAFWQIFCILCMPIQLV